MYIFFHLIKTGGTSLRLTLFQRFLQRGYLVYPYYGAFFERKYALPPIVQSVQTDEARFFIGHYCYYGMHEDLNRPAKYIVFLRDPVKRLESWYYHDFVECVKAKTTPPSFESWVEAYPAVNRTKLTRTLIYGLTNFSKLSSNLENAKSILKSTSFIGMQETFESDVKQLIAPNVHIFRDNVTETKCQRNNITLTRLNEEQMAYLESISSDDRELYNYAIGLRNQGHNNGFRIPNYEEY